MDPPYAAIVLAGGGARRMGGRSKPALAVAGRPMLDRVLDAVADAVRRVVVGPDDLAVPPGVRLTRENPPGGGPVAAVAAGLAALREVPGGADVVRGRAGPDPEGAGPAWVAVLAADLPLLDRASVRRLQGAALGTGNADVALYVDAAGRPQSLCAVWRVESLHGRCAALGAPLTGRAMRDLMAGARVVAVTSPPGTPPPWFDCDTDDDLDRARSWLRAAHPPAE